MMPYSPDSLSRLAGAAAIALALVAVGPTAARADPDLDYAEELIARAVELRLHESPTWHALLHYEDRLLRPLRSLARSPGFFADPAGDHDPERELAATLLAFFDPASRADDGPAQCRFVARFHWLESQLHFDPARLPRAACESFSAWRERLPSKRLSLVFAEAFLDNPASMFGHTLLRLDDGEEDTRLLGYAIDFTGDIGDDGPIAYLAKGPIGIYPGYFALGPWYQKLERYTEWENRDIWNYALDLDEQEIDFFLMHLWELRGVAFPYWFFDDNCSYQLLKLLEVVRAESGLTTGFPAQVLPVDTVRAVARAGWVEKVSLRPSPASELQRTGNALPPDQRRLARRLASGEAEPADPELTALTREEQAHVLGVAYEALKYDFLAGRVAQDESRARSRRLLVARSRLGRLDESPDGANDPTPSTSSSRLRPDHGHPTSLVALGSGFRDGEAFVELRIRPALHDLLDPSEGHTPFNRVSVLDTRVRYEPERGRVRLEELVVLDVASMSPRDRFIRPIAWSFDTGLRTRLVADPSPGDDFDPEPVWRSHGGVGLAAAATAWATVYGLAEATLDVGTALSKDVSFGPGASVGLRIDSFGERFHTHLHAGITRFLAGDRTTWYRGGLEQRLSLSQSLALQAGLHANRIDGDEWLEARLSISLYF